MTSFGITATLVEATNPAALTPVERGVCIPAAMFPGAARASLNPSLADGSSRLGTVVKDTQIVAATFFVGGSIDQQTQFNNAADSLLIPLDTPTLGVPAGSYQIYLRYKMTGAQDSTYVGAAGLYTYNLATQIGVSYDDGTAWSTCRWLDSAPIYHWLSLGAKTVTATASKKLRVRAYASGGSPDIRLEQIWLHDTNDVYFYLGQIDYYYTTPNTPMLDSAPWAGGIWSVYFSGSSVGGTLRSGQNVEYQKGSSSSYYDLEPSEVEIGNSNWSSPTKMWFVGLGAVYLPAATLTDDTFARTQSPNWAYTPESYNWWCLNGTYSVTPGAGQVVVGANSTSPGTTAAATLGNALVSTGAQTGQLARPRAIDMPPQNLKLIATLKWTATPSGASYVVVVGTGGRTGVSGNDQTFTGLAILLSGGTAYAVFVAYNTSMSTHGGIYHEAGSRVSLGAIAPGTVVTVEIDRQGQEASGSVTIGGVTTTIPKTGLPNIALGGGYPYPNRIWVDYPYTGWPNSFSFDGLTPYGGTYSFWGVDQRFPGINPGMIFNNLSTTSQTVIVSEFKVLWDPNGSAPANAYIGIEPQDGHVSPVITVLPYGSSHAIYYNIDRYGDANADTSADWKYKLWMDTGSADFAWTQGCDSLFIQYPLTGYVAHRLRHQT